MWSEALAAAAFADARILIVEDDREVGALLRRLFVSVGYRSCRCVHDALEMEATLQSFSPDILLLSWEMGPNGGRGLLEDLLELLPEEVRPSILVLTEGVTNQARRDALAAGAAGFVSKPFDAAEVLLRVRNLITLRRGRMKLEQQVYLRTLQLEQTIGELRHVRRQLAQQERLRTLGGLAAGIAHDFNNALTIVLGFSELYLGRDVSTEDPESMRRAFQVITTAASDAAGTVRRLREFYRPNSPVDAERRLIHINDVVHESIQLALPKWMTETQARGVTVELKEEYGNPPKILANASELREVLMNLIFNAVDAMQDGGVLTVRTASDDCHVSFEVEDTGRGMDPQTRERCLEPFFTTKGQSGSGLGLATSFEIIQRHHGNIEIVTALNRGSLFRITLPITQPSETEPVEVMETCIRGLKVLVVDNQRKICQVLKDFLEVDGHVAVAAASAHEALELSQRESFDLVITDLVMPSMNGHQLAVALKEQNPRLPVILFTSLYDVPDPKAPIDRILQKPAGLSDLRAAIQDAFASVRSSDEDFRSDLPAGSPARGLDVHQVREALTEQRQFDRE